MSSLRVPVKIFLFFALIFPTYRNGEHESPEHYQRQIVARIDALKGDVFVRRLGEGTWKKANLGQVLYRLDRIYAGSGSVSIVLLEQHRARIRLDNNALYEVDSDLPVNTRVARRLNDERPNPSQPVRRGGTGSAITTVFQAPALDDEEESEEADGSYSPSGLSLDWQVTESPLFFPQGGGVTVLVKSVPLVVPVVFRAEGESKRMVGNLWKRAQSAIPVSVSSLEGENWNIQVPEPGDYIFQAISEDGTSKTRPFRITVSMMKADAEMLRREVLPATVAFGETVYMP